MRQLRGVEKPREEGARLAVAAEGQQGLQGEGGIARPGEAVVPVACAADLLGQRRRRRGGDRPRGGVDEQLERERAAHDRLAPRPVVRPPARPVAPARGRLPNPRLDVGARRQDERLLVGGHQDDQPAGARVEGEPSADGTLAHGGVAETPGQRRNGITAPSRDRDAGSGRERCSRSSVVEAWLDRKLHRHATSDAFHMAGELAVRAQRQSRQGHCVGDADGTRGRRERRLQHVGVREVASLALVGDRGGEREPTTALAVEQCREHARRVEIGQAEPVDRAVTADESGCATVANHRVVADRQVAVDARHVHTLS